MAMSAAISSIVTPVSTAVAGGCVGRRSPIGPRTDPGGVDRPAVPAYAIAMASCLHCDGAKGKRDCPALGGMICPTCCGRHRLGAIACPPGCRWLGGLAVVREPSARAFTRDDYAAAVDKLMAFALSSREAAARHESLAFLRDLIGEEGGRGGLDGDEIQAWMGPVIDGFLCYGARDRDRRRAVDRLIAARGRDLSTGEVAALGALAQARASLFEVVAVQVGAGLTLRDRLGDGEIQVREVTASTQLRPGDVIFAWVMAVGDHLELTGASMQVPPAHVATVATALADELDELRAETPAADVAEIADVALDALAEAVAAWRPPELVTTHGEPLLFCAAHYTVGDGAAVRARLVAHADIDGDDLDGGGPMTWLDRAPNPALANGPTVLGQLRVADGELVLETNSRARLARGRAMIEETLGQLAAHRADTFQDPEAALRDGAASPSASTSPEVPPEVAAEIIGRYLRAHYTRWMDEPLPALDGKTPRKAARTAAGKRSVAALVDDAERMSLRMPGQAAPGSFDWLRRELGLPVHEASDDGLGYDADLAPDPSAWLGAAEDVREQAVRAYHARLTDQPPVAKPGLHTALHVIVENQLAAGDPEETAATLHRLVSAGTTRHEAIHAVASVVVREMDAVVRQKRRYDRVRVARELDQLRARDWQGA